MNWIAVELAAAAGLDEIQVAPDRKDGTRTEPVTIWAVEHDGDLYARSAGGPSGLWYRRAMASGRRRVRVAGVDREAESMDAATDADHAALDATYQQKYHRYGARIMGAVVSAAPYAVTIRIRLITERCGGRAAAPSQRRDRRNQPLHRSQRAQVDADRG